MTERPGDTDPVPFTTDNPRRTRAATTPEGTAAMLTQSQTQTVLELAVRTTLPAGSLRYIRFTDDCDQPVVSAQISTRNHMQAGDVEALLEIEQAATGVDPDEPDAPGRSPVRVLVFQGALPPQIRLIAEALWMRRRPLAAVLTITAVPAGTELQAGGAEDSPALPHRIDIYTPDGQERTGSHDIELPGRPGPEAGLHTGVNDDHTLQHLIASLLASIGSSGQLGLDEMAGALCALDQLRPIGAPSILSGSAEDIAWWRSVEGVIDEAIENTRPDDD